MNEHEKINHVEFPSRDLEVTKHFFIRAFDWSFQDYGPDYTAFTDQGIDGGFYCSEQQAPSSNCTALVIFYSRYLEAT
jgi:predicted enzyme related to lactoylglutathione lyase